MTRTLVIGIDGATFDVLDTLIDAGEMPNLASLQQRGTRAELRSTMPPVTGPAWLSLATGLSPGSTGVYDFIWRRPNTDGFQFDYLDIHSFKGRSLWDLLSEAGYKVGIVDYPLLTPPYSTNGFMIASGLGSDGLEAYPPELSEQLSTFEHPEGHLDLRDPNYNDVSRFYSDISDNLERRIEILEYALGNQEWEFAWAVLQEPDWFQHLMWKYFDKDHPEFDSSASREQKLFRKFWQQVDDAIGRCMKVAGDGSNIIIQSDHGFGPLFDRSFRLNTWLIREGYLTPKSFASSQFWLKKRFRGLLRDVASAVRLRSWAPGIFEWGKSTTAALGIQLNSIDLQQTKVFEPGHIGSMGGLYINESALSTGESVQQIKEEIRDKLSDYGETFDLDIAVHFPEQLYGAKKEGSPDIIVRIPGTMIEDGGWDRPIIDSLPTRLSHQNGSHRENGVFVAAGPDFMDSTIDEIRAWDLAPTLLHCFEQQIPNSMDGNVIQEALSFSRPVQRIDVAEDHTNPAVTGDEHEEIQEQLSSLGYFE